MDFLISQVLLLKDFHSCFIEEEILVQGVFMKLVTATPGQFLKLEIDLFKLFYVVIDSCLCLKPGI